MDTSTIADTAEATGFTASALRFYEKAGLISPGRTPAGYRTYDEHDVTVLRFIARAKQIGCSLEEIAALVPLLDHGNCAVVHQQMRTVVAAKIADTQQQTTDLVAFLGQLQQIATGLAAAPLSEAPCDDRCTCTTDPATSAGDDARWKGVPLAPSRGATPIACTLSPDAMPDRVADWQRVTDQAVDREVLADGVRLRLPRTVDIAAVAELMAAEQTCCSFFTFSLTIESSGVVLDVRAPEDGLPIVHAITGVPA